MKNFNVYDPMKKGQGLVLDGQSLAHIEVLLNSEGTEEGSLLQLLGRCVTPFGQFYSFPSQQSRSFLSSMLQESGCSASGCACLCAVSPISMLGKTRYSVPWFIELNAFVRLDAVEDLMNHPTFETEFMEVAKGLPDLERIVSRIHAKNCKVKDFLKVLKVMLLVVISFSTQPFLQSFSVLSKGLSKLADASETFESKTILGLLRSAPDLLPHVKNVEMRFEKTEKSMLTLRLVGNGPS
jgi:DNA mismatch repair protein MSH6